MWGRVATGLSAFMALLAPATAAAAGPQTRYSLAGGCYTVSGLDQFGALRFQATDLGRYLLYTQDGKNATHAPPRPDDASPDAVWTVGADMALNGKPATFTPANGC